MTATIRVSLVLSLSFLAGCGGPSSDGTTDSELSTIPSTVDPDVLYLLVEEQVDDTSQRSMQANQVRRAWHVLTWEVFDVLPLWLQSLCTDDPFAIQPVSLLGSLIQVPDAATLYWDEAAGDHGALVLASSVDEVPEEHVDDLVGLESGATERVTLCHVPPGNPGNVHTLSISKRALEAHLAHGDSLGECAEGSDVGTDDGSVQGLTLASVCSDAHGVERRWGVHNPNDVDVEVTWGVFGAFQTGVVVASPGDSYFFTDTVEGDNTTVIIWLDGDGVEQSDVEASTGDQCEGADSDRDGVSDAVDGCPGTPDQEDVDDQGCSCSQRDADSDGVDDCDDECPDTEQGVSVDATGCEAEDQVGAGCDLDDQNQAGLDSILVAPAVSVDGASTTGQQYDFASVEVFIDPAVTRWIAWNSTSDVSGTHPDYPEETFLGPGGFGTDDFIRVTIVAPDGTSLTKDIDKNNVSAENFGTQNIIFGTATAAPDVIRRSTFGGDYLIIHEAGSHNSIFSVAGTYRFEFSFRDAFCCHAGHTDIYLLIGQVPGPDADGDCVPDSTDNCPLSANVDQQDSDQDGVGDACDACPDDPNDGCEIDLCPTDDNKTQPGQCGCGIPDDDTDSDGTADCNDGCPDDAAKTSAGSCGCGISDMDTDSDGTLDCNDNCVQSPNANQLDSDRDGIGDACDDSDDSDEDNDGIPAHSDQCPNTPDGESVDDVGCSCSQKLPASFHLGPFINPANGHEYYWLCESVWTAAEDTAVVLGGHLVTINDAAEHAWVRETFDFAGRRWLGLTDQDQEGKWIWISGEPVSYTDWLPNEPNSGSSEDYAEMGSLANQGWNDVPNNGWGILHYGIVEVVP